MAKSVSFEILQIVLVFFFKINKFDTVAKLFIVMLDFQQFCECERIQHFKYLIIMQILGSSVRTSTVWQRSVHDKRNVIPKSECL